MIAKMRNIGEACTAANRFHVADVGRRASSPRSWPSRMGAMKVGRGTEDGRRGRPADRRDAARQGRRAGRGRARQGRRRALVGGTRARRRGLLLRARPCSAGVPDDARAAQGGDLRPGRARRSASTRRGGGDRRRQRHRVRPRRLRLHARPQARVPRLRGARDRHGRPQPGHGLQRRRRRSAASSSPASAARAATRASTSTSRPSTSRWRCEAPEAIRSRQIHRPERWSAAGTRRAVAAGCPSPRPWRSPPRRRTGCRPCASCCSRASTSAASSSSRTTRSRKGARAGREPARGARALLEAAAAPGARSRAPVERLTEAESDAYFARARAGSQLGAWASTQGTADPGPRCSRRALADASERYPGEACRGRRTGAATGCVPTRSSSGRAARTASTTARHFPRADGGWRAERLSP